MWDIYSFLGGVLTAQRHGQTTTAVPAVRPSSGAGVTNGGDCGLAALDATVWSSRLKDACVHGGLTADLGVEILRHTAADLMSLRDLRMVLLVADDGTDWHRCVRRSWPTSPSAPRRYADHCSCILSSRCGRPPIKPVYTAPTEEAALDRFSKFAEVWGKKYPAIVRLWENAWEEFTPFLRFDTEIRRIVCTTNAIESVNARIRRAVMAAVPLTCTGTRPTGRSGCGGIRRT